MTELCEVVVRPGTAGTPTGRARGRYGRGSWSGVRP